MAIKINMGGVEPAWKQSLQMQGAQQDIRSAQNRDALAQADFEAKLKEMERAATLDEEHLKLAKRRTDLAEQLGIWGLGLEERRTGVVEGQLDLARGSEAFDQYLAEVTRGDQRKMAKARALIDFTLTAEKNLDPAFQERAMTFAKSQAAIDDPAEVMTNLAGHMNILDRENEQFRLERLKTRLGEFMDILGSEESAVPGIQQVQLESKALTDRIANGEARAGEAQASDQAIRDKYRGLVTQETVRRARLAQVDGEIERALLTPEGKRMIPVLAAERASILMYGDIDPSLVKMRLDASIESLKADGRLGEQQADLATKMLEVTFGDPEAAQKALNWVQQTNGGRQPTGKTMEDIEKVLRDRQGGLANGAAASAPVQGPPPPPPAQRPISQFTPAAEAARQAGTQVQEEASKKKVEREQEIADLRAQAATLRRKIRNFTAPGSKDAPLSKSFAWEAEKAREELKKINAKIAKLM